MSHGLKELRPSWHGDRLCPWQREFGASACCIVATRKQEFELEMGMGCNPLALPTVIPFLAVFHFPRVSKATRKPYYLGIHCSDISELNYNTDEQLL